MIALLAPTGAQEILIFVRPFVCLSGSSVSEALNLYHSGLDIQAALISLSDFSPLRLL